MWLLTLDEYEKLPDGTKLVQTGYLVQEGKIVIKGKDEIDIEPVPHFSRKGRWPWSKSTPSPVVLVGFLDDDYSPKPAWFSKHNRMYNDVPAKDLESKP